MDRRFVFIGTMLIGFYKIIYGVNNQMNEFMPAASFLLQSVLITIPGFLTPGPVMAITIERGTRSPHAGVFVMLGHGAVELPLVILLFMGLGRFAREPHIRFVLALAGGIFLFYMAWKTFRARKTDSPSPAGVSSSSFIAGAVMTLANPFLLLWWSTIGSVLILRSIELGFVVSILFYALHFITNLIWLYFISYMSFIGRSVLGRGYILVISIVCGGILLVFSGYFIFSAYKIIIL